MRKTSKAFGVLAFAGVLLAGCGPKSSSGPTSIADIDGRPAQLVTGPYLAGETAYRDYKAIMSYNAETFNPVISQSAQDGDHITNFVDGLLENDEFGRLSYALAESATANASSDVFTFKIKDGIKWVKNDGTQYVAEIGGEQVPQFVTPSDFIAAVMANLDFVNGAETQYIVSMFIEGGAEYNEYTYATYRLAAGAGLHILTEEGIGLVDQATYDGLAEADQKEILVQSIYFYTMYYDGILLDITAADLPAIAAGERIGVQDLGDNEIEFTLTQTAPYFPSVLTYSCFLPINQAFIDEVGFENFGMSAEDMVYNGAFVASKWTETEIEYSRNPEYWDADEVHLDKVNFALYPTEAGYDYLRTQFELGNIDGFNVSDLDTVGWAKYVTGTEGTGTLENPANGAAYSRYIETVDSAFHVILNLDRDVETEWVEEFSTVTAAEVENFNRAVKLRAVRELFLKGWDLKEYNKSRGATTQAQDEIQIHTYTAKGFAVDSEGNDYVEKYVYDAFDAAELSEDPAAEVLALGQTEYNGVTNYDDVQVQSLVVAAEAEVAAWNLANPDQLITYPIKTEFLGLPDADYNRYDQGWIDDFNERTNGCTIKTDSTSGLPLCDESSYPKFQLSLIGLDITVDGEGYTDLGYSGQYGLHVMGWGPDYADPLTYLNTYVTGGDMAMFTGDDDRNNPIPGWHLEGAVLVADEYTTTGGKKLTGIAAKYSGLVEEGKAITDDTALRYEKFADAEIELLFETNLMRMSYNAGQGWFVTVSKTMAYERPTAAYGLSSSKFKGMWVLTDILEGATRRTLKAQYDEAKTQISEDDEGVFVPTILA